LSTTSSGPRRISGLGWIGLVYGGFPGSCLEGTQERTDGVLPYSEDDRLGVPLCVFVFDRHIAAFPFRKEKEKTAHSGDDGQRNRLRNPQAGVLPVADGDYLRIKQAKVSCGKFAFVDCFARFVVESQMGLVAGVEISDGWHRNIIGRSPNVSGLIATQHPEGSIHEQNTGQKQSEEPTNGKSL
jgi:hypothetical protein